MPVEYRDQLTVPVSRLRPGSQRKDAFVPAPWLGWHVWEDTFQWILEHPQNASEKWPIFPYWRRWCLERYGHLPDTLTPIPHGGLWTWERWEKAFRRISAWFWDGEHDPAVQVEPIEVVIGPRGGIVVVNGNKRVALTRLRDRLEKRDTKVTVNVVGRTPEWKAFCATVRSLSGKQALYQPIPHPEFDDWPVSQPCVERWDMIFKEFGSMYRASVLDIGSNTGWFVRQVAKHGGVALGIDADEVIVDVAKVVQEMDGLPEGPSGQVAMNVQDFLVRGNAGHFDVCLCLSVLMHMFAQHRKDTWEIVRRLSVACDTMFIDVVWGGYSEVLPFTPENFVQEMLAHTEYKTVNLLGRTKHENRPFYVCRR